MIRLVTVGGEYGSGRAEIAEGVSKRLGWKLLDSCLIADIARVAQVQPELARRFDETTDPWMHRLQKALWHGGFEGVVTTTEMEPDADSIADAAGRVVQEAAEQGGCVIVGRGGQCVLQQRPDVFHVFIYAPRKQRVEAVLRRDGPDVDAEALMDTWDRRRAAYIRRHFDQNWTNPHLYNMMICSSIGEDAAAEAISAAIRKMNGDG